MSSTARAISPMPPAVAAGREDTSGEWHDFLAALAADPHAAAHAGRMALTALDTVRELVAERRWEDIVDLLLPLEEKIPEARATGLEEKLAREAAFALGRLGRHDEAIVLLTPLAGPGASYHTHYALAFQLVESLRPHRDHGVRTSPAERRRRIRLAHEHYRICQEMRPDGVTPFYREGALYAEIENHDRHAVPLFERAVSNWLALDDAVRAERHRERPKYLKARYHLAASLIRTGRARAARPHLEAIMSEPGRDRHVAAVFQHFTMGKCLYHLGEWDQAAAHLRTAASCAAASRRGADFIHELMARVQLAAGRPDQALAAVDAVPADQRRPYVRWTRGDALLALNRTDEAEKEWRLAARRDRRGRHKALLRICRLAIMQGQAEKAIEAATQAREFHRQTYGSDCHEADFWRAAALHAAGRDQEARDIVDGLAADGAAVAGLGALRRCLAPGTGHDGGQEG